MCLHEDLQREGQLETLVQEVLYVKQKQNGSVDQSITRTCDVANHCYFVKIRGVLK